MKNYDAVELSARLNALAEVFNAKALTEAALKIWFASLKEFPADMVFGRLTSWPKEHSKFPAPADIWKIANAIGIAERERAAALERSANAQPVRFERSEAGNRALREIKAMLARPRPSPVEHWRRALATAAPGSITEHYAREALARLEGRNKMREPGEDDDQRAAA
jgi:hypothetical protein